MADSTSFKRFLSLFFSPLIVPWRFHFWGSLLLVVFTSLVISEQISDRFGFANSELYNDVSQRWGSPIAQAAPSLRYVNSGAVFNELMPLTFNKQHISVDAKMNYRKRGLVYFSGFNFDFRGHYEAGNPTSNAIDMVFVFPVQLEKNKVLLSNLTFKVNGENKPVSLDSNADKFIWTGQLTPGEKIQFDVAFSGRGLNSFQYQLDPDLAVKDFIMEMKVTGGDNYDYPSFVVPATQINQTDAHIKAKWNYPSLQSGIPTGIILPSEKSFDRIIATLVSRAWVPFILLFGVLVVLAQYQQIRLKFFQSYLVASGYAFYFVLIAYFAAFMNFYIAFILASIITLGLLWFYIHQLLQGQQGKLLLAVLSSLILLPSIAVILQGYTGLIYTIGILIALISTMIVTSQLTFHNAVDELLENGEKS